MVEKIRACVKKTGRVEISLQITLKNAIILPAIG
jgi:hypothetical protein